MNEIKMEIARRLSLQWARVSVHVKMDWAGFENMVRDILQAYTKEQLTATESIECVDEALGAWTGRGTVIKR